MIDYITEVMVILRTILFILFLLCYAIGIVLVPVAVMWREIEVGSGWRTGVGHVVLAVLGSAVFLSVTFPLVVLLRTWAMGY